MPELTLHEDLAFPYRRQEPRAPGLHVSNVIRDMMETAGVAAGHGPIDDVARRKIEAGYVWEDALSEAWARGAEGRVGVIRPEPVVVDGIVVSPDGIDCGRGLVVEYKFTARSAAGKEPVPEGWLWQVGAYCRCYGMTEAEIHVCHFNGDYRERRRPMYCRWDVAWNVAELRKRWAALVAHADRMRKEVQDV